MSTLPDTIESERNRAKSDVAFAILFFCGSKQMVTLFFHKFPGQNPAIAIEGDIIKPWL